jgi:DNA-binding CsgD family transcriptional regulator
VKTRGRPRHPDTLTPRQQEVLDLLRHGLTNEEIAQRLGISLDGAKYHVADILRRLQVDSRYEAAEWRPEPARRPWYAVLAPFGLLGKLKAKVVAQIAGAAIIIGGVAGVALLAWGVVRSSSDAETVRELPDADRFIAATGLPALPSGSSQVLSYDPLNGDLRGLSIPVAEPMRLSPAGDKIAFGLGPSLVVSTLDGAQTMLDRQAAGAEATDWSSDGERILFVGSDGLTSMEVATGAVTPLLDGNVQDAVWSPDERRIAFVRDQRLGVLDLDTGANETIAPELQAIYLPNIYGNGHLAWSPDGEWIAFGHWTLEDPVTQGRSDLYIVRPDGSDLRRLTNSSRAKRYLAFSPDGKYLAYVHSADNGDNLGIVDVASGTTVSTQVKVAVSLVPQWVSNDALLTSDYQGIALARIDGTSRLLIASAGDCQRWLIGWGAGRIVFGNRCNSGGL